MSYWLEFQCSNPGRLALGKEGNLVLDLVQLLWKQGDVPELRYCRRGEHGQGGNLVHWSNIVSCKHLRGRNLCDRGEHRSRVPCSWTVRAVPRRQYAFVEPDGSRSLLLQ